MKRILLVDANESHAKGLAECLTDRSFCVECTGNVESAVHLLRSGPRYDLVILDVSESWDKWCTAIRQLQHAGIQSDHPVWCRILCLSKRFKPADFVVRIERLGCRYVFER